MQDNLSDKTNKIKFTVEGKPPKKTKPSLWSENSKQTKLVTNLRQKAYDASKELGDEYLHGPIKLSLTVYDPNPEIRVNRPDYLGDLDALIGGIFEVLQASPPENNGLVIHSDLKNNDEIKHDIPLIIADDAQITTTVSKKRVAEKPYYIVSIERDEEFSINNRILTE